MPVKNQSREFILPTAERILFVYRGLKPEYVAFWRRRGAWQCVDTSEKLAFLSVTPIDRIEETVTKLGWRWKWHNPPDDKIMNRSLEYKRKHGGSF